jgi:hypothetical protein
MANIQNDYPMGGYGETEEERRRRLEQKAAEEAAAGKTTNWSDIPGQLLDKKLTDFQNRVDNISQYATDPEAAIRQRLFDEKPTPVKQTITTDPETGAQTMKIEGSVQDLSAANPMTPTVSGPVVPAMGQGGAGKPGETAVGGTEPTPDQTEQQRRADGLRAMMSGAGTQVAGPVPTPAAAAPVAAPVAPTQTFAEDVAARKAAQPSLGAQPVAPTSVVPVNAVTQITSTGAPVVAAPAPATSLAQAGAQALVAPAAAVPAAAEPAWVAAANAAGGDLIKLFDVAAKHPESRVAIQEKMLASMEGRNKEQEARKLVEAAASGNPKAVNKLMQVFRPESGKQKEEVTVNDYLKAYMYQRLGLNELAADVQKKIIGKDSKFGQITLGDSVWKTETNSQGDLIRAWDDENTPATKSTLAKLSAEGLKVSTATPPSAGATRIRDSEGTEFSVVPTPRGSKFYNNKGEQAVPVGRTVPIAVSSDLEIAQNKLDMETVANFAKQTSTERIKAFENTNKLRADRRLPLLSLAEMGLNPDGSIIGEAIRRPGAPTAPAAAAPPVAAAAPPVAAAAPVAAPAAAPVVSQSTIPTPTVSRVTTTPSGKIPTAAEMESQTKVDDLNRAIIEAAAKAKINVGQNLEEQKNKIRMTMPSSEQNANRVLATLNDIDTHPGLDKTVGLPRILATPLEMIPGGDQRAFAQKFKQLGGQEFLAAYDQLRGGGGISVVEGEKAEQAISALKDTGISPAEFKKNMWIFRDAVQTGLDKQRELIGLPMKYRESPQREEAKAWLRANPNSPKAEAVRKMLAGF